MRKRLASLAIFALHFATLLIAESALSFLGISAPLGASTWGNMLADGRAYVLPCRWAEREEDEGFARHRFGDLCQRAVDIGATAIMVSNHGGFVIASFFPLGFEQVRQWGVGVNGVP